MICSKLTRLSISDIEVDGGVGPATVSQCCSAGANMIVAGTAITQALEPKSVIDEIRQLATKEHEKSIK